MFIEEHMVYIQELRNEKPREKKTENSNFLIPKSLQPIKVQNFYIPN